MHRLKDGFTIHRKSQYEQRINMNPINQHIINGLGNLRGGGLKVAVDAFVRFVRCSHSEINKLIYYAVGKVLGFVKDDAIKTLPEDGVVKSFTAPILHSCPVLSKESVRLRFKLSIGDGLLDAHIEECA